MPTDSPDHRPTRDERRADGRERRQTVPRKSHAGWTAPPDRADPVALVAEQNDSRWSPLVPIRHGRMSVSPFTFYRGAARVMAHDLAHTPVSGLQAQICGDAHLSNFGVFASPERKLVFDANDFDETLPGPWEWDVKRLAASFTIAGQHRGFTPEQCDAITARSVAVYRESMATFSAMNTLDLWYEHLSTEDLHGLAESFDKEQRKALERFEAKARSKDSLQALHKLAEDVDGQYRIKSQPPVLIPLRDLPEEFAERPLAELQAGIDSGFVEYRDTLPEDRRHLLDRFRPVDLAIKVVGVGSVGTRCLIMLLEGQDRDDPLFLQIKEANPSVLEEVLEPSAHPHHGQRVVEGQRFMQAVSDIFLGWTTGPGGRDFYVRQLRDWKGSFDVETATEAALLRYAELCGWTLARSHARSGDAVAISGYLGTGDTFDRAVVEFCTAYAAQNAADYDAFKAAIDRGDLEARAD